MFAIGQRSVQKVIMEKLYDSEGRRVKSIFKKTLKAYMDDPINWDEEMENASNISHEEIIYKFYYQDGENADLPMLGAQTKVKHVKAILERTLNFPRSSEGSQPLKLRVVFKRNQLFENQVITQVATREAREEVYRQVGIEMSRQSDMAEAMEQSTETLLSVDTATDEVLKREQMELGSPITKVRKVTAPDQVTPGMSEKPSQTRKEECIDLTNISVPQMKKCWKTQVQVKW